MEHQRNLMVVDGAGRLRVPIIMHRGLICDDQLRRSFLRAPESLRD